MNIKDTNKPGIIAWGTKRGQSVFFATNVKDDAEVVNTYLVDVRTPVRISAIRREFFSFERYAQYAFFSVYRTIVDWAGRHDGYYAITIFAPKGLELPLEQMPDILKALSALYWDKYIATSTETNQIDKKSRENPIIFTQLLEDKLSGLVGSAVYTMAGTENRYITYQNQDELKHIFKHFQSVSFRNIKQLAILPAEQNGLSSGYPKFQGEIDSQLIINEADIQPVSCIISTKDESKNYIANIPLRLNHAGESLEIQTDERGVFIIDLMAEDELTIQYLGQDYQPALISGKVKLHTLPASGKAIFDLILIPKSIESPEIKKPEINTTIPENTDDGGDDKSFDFGAFLRKNKLLVAALILVSAIIVLVLIFWGNSSDSNTQAYYKKLNNSLDSATQKVLSPDWQWDHQEYARAKNYVLIRKHEFDSLKTKESQKYILDSTKFLIVLERLDRQYVEALKAEIDTFVKGIDFDLRKAEKLEKAARTLDAGVIKAEVTTLEAFINLCKNIKEANNIIAAEDNEAEHIEAIKGRLEWTLNDTNDKYGFLNKVQREVIFEYARLLENIRSNSNGKYTLAGFLAWTEDNTTPERRRQINEFIEGRLNK